MKTAHVLSLVAGCILLVVVSICATVFVCSKLIAPVAVVVPTASVPPVPRSLSGPVESGYDLPPSPVASRSAAVILAAPKGNEAIIAASLGFLAAIGAAYEDAAKAVETTDKEFADVSSEIEASETAASKAFGDVVDAVVLPTVNDRTGKYSDRKAAAAAYRSVSEAVRESAGKKP